MRLKRLVWASIGILTMVAQASCNAGKAAQPTPDVNAIYTSAARTMIAGQSAEETKTAKAATPTTMASPTALAALPTFPVGTNSVPFGTPSVVFGTARPTTVGGLPTLPVAAGTANTGLTAVGCDNATYVSETAPLDKTKVDSGKDFTKGWQMQNTGTCSWGTGYSWVFVSGDDMGCNNVTIKTGDTETAPGHSNSFLVHCTAPTTAGEYKAFYQMKNASGVAFGFSPWVDIVVP